MHRSRRLNQLALWAVAVAVLLPLLAGLTYALAYSLGLFGLLSHGFDLSAWEAVLSDPAVWQSFGWSALVAALAVGIASALALATALWWPEHQERSLSVLYWPMAVPPLVAAFWGFQLLGDSGLLSRLAFGLGWIQSPAQFPALINDSANIGVLLVLILLSYPLLAVLFRQYARSERIAALLQLSATLGASNGQSLWQVAVPVLLRKAWPSILLYFIILFGSYEVPLLLGSQAPRMISVAIAQQFRRFDLALIPQAYALSCLYALFVGCLLWISRRTAVKTGQS